ncbi:hypothetical protein DFJ66_7740 [Saccharothrix variisporea]|uniref:Uncharacterized protein n=1 Tax=Saccharothrix variisporea TaxID=543527 RepID=A0A495XIR9_9PSEU|nr:hypothetical protein DFJ66_7740 [Saccharothrix variisporea]
MTRTATLAVDTADLAQVDEEALVQWSAAHLADCTANATSASNPAITTSVTCCGWPPADNNRPRLT